MALAPLLSTHLEDSPYLPEGFLEVNPNVKRQSFVKILTKGGKHSALRYRPDSTSFSYEWDGGASSPPKRYDTYMNLPLPLPRGGVRVR